MFLKSTRFMWRSKVAQLTVLVLMLLISFSMAASQDKVNDKEKKTLVGTWNMTTVLGGKELHAMVTFFSDGTFIHTGASKDNVNAHGVWKKVGPLTFVEQNREYVYQGDELALFADTTEVITMSEDGMSWVGEAVAELKHLDGVTVTEVIPFTIYGTRMTLDF